MLFSICIFLFHEMSVGTFAHLKIDLWLFFLAVLCLPCYAERLSLVVTTGGYSLVAVLELLIGGLLSLWSIGFMVRGLSSCHSEA